MTDTDNFDTEMAEFAKSLRKKASEANTSLEDATNAFKALTTYYAILRKYPADPSAAGETFDDILSDVHGVVAQEAANGGTPQVRSRRRGN